MTRLTACTINTANGGKPKPIAITSRIGTARRRNTGGEVAITLKSEALIPVFLLVISRSVHAAARHRATAEHATCKASAGVKPLFIAIRDRDCGSPGAICHLMAGQY